MQDETQHLAPVDWRDFFRFDVKASVVWIGCALFLVGLLVVLPHWLRGQERADFAGTVAQTAPGRRHRLPDLAGLAGRGRAVQRGHGGVRPPAGVLRPAVRKQVAAPVPSGRAGHVSGGAKDGGGAGGRGDAPVGACLTPAGVPGTGRRSRSVRRRRRRGGTHPVRPRLAVLPHREGEEFWRTLRPSPLPLSASGRVARNEPGGVLFQPVPPPAVPPLPLPRSLTLRRRRRPWASTRAPTAAATRGRSRPVPRPASCVVPGLLLFAPLVCLPNWLAASAKKTTRRRGL